MAHSDADRLHRHLRGLIAAENSSLSDRELLERFTHERDEAAFNALVQRHGPMILHLCQSVLRDLHDAEDAFQAAFLVLVRKASSIRKQCSVGSWLYKVSYRIALRARSDVARRRRQEQQAASPEGRDPQDDLTWRELRSILSEELGRLKESYRTPLILCCLEGRTRDEAAQQLGWSLGMLKGRLERGRELLRSRLCAGACRCRRLWGQPCCLKRR